jgi:hypothetical protein
MKRWMRRSSLKVAAGTRNVREYMGGRFEVKQSDKIILRDVRRTHRFQ